jgi:hypothetical protein
MTAEILLSNLRTLHKLLSPKYKSPDLLTELLIVMGSAEQQATQLWGDQPNQLIKVLNEALNMCDSNKIKRHISKHINSYL